MTNLTFRKVRSEGSLGADALKVTLFRDGSGRVCGWYLGPVRIEANGVAIPYLPRSKCVRASVAIVRALTEAAACGASLCVVDPDDLWDPAWAA